MAKIEIVLNTSGVRELLRSKEMMSICEKYANNALSKLGDGYEVTTQVDDRVNASIAAKSYRARKENMENNTILKALR